MFMWPVVLPVSDSSDWQPARGDLHLSLSCRMRHGCVRWCHATNTLLLLTGVSLMAATHAAAQDIGT